MHRTTTTATLLVTVAVTALSGCVTVQRPPSGPQGAPSQPSAPRTDGEAEPQVVQAPAREALELIGPSRKPSPSAAPAHRAAPPPAAAAPAPPRHRPHPAPHPEPEGRRPQPRVAVSPVAPDVPQNSDVCALGRKYGGWQPDSPQAVICRETYGH
ncbi:hypothetical protein [Streptomyces sp. NPDC058252]|uniref:hypothetical protein n=1 Tax=unclassified Streptomyces TaxID=2593676 RepID=UPI0036E3070A